MRLIERWSPVGPWLTSPVTAVVECDPSEVAALPGVVESGVGVWPFARRLHVARLEGRDPGTADAIMAL